MSSEWETFVERQHQRVKSHPNAYWVVFALLGVVNVMNGLTRISEWFAWLFIVGGIFLLWLSSRYFRWARQDHYSEPQSD